MDHINRDGLDNRRCNLRIATTSQNNCNSCIRRDNRSGVKGVAFYRKAGKWGAEIAVNGKRYWLGLFPTIEAASIARQRAATRLHGEFARY